METEKNAETPSPISGWFVPLITPYGGAPEQIRQQWIGVPLPVRERNIGLFNTPRLGADVDSFEPRVKRRAVPIDLNDAILALRLSGQDSAADWWGGFQHELDIEIYAETLSFELYEGEYFSFDEVSVHVELANLFDSN